MLKTKILATLGPSSNDEKTINALYEAGAKCFRFNLKHGELYEHKARIMLVRKIAKNHDSTAVAMVDLQGPEVRIGQLKNNKLELKNRELIALAQKSSKKYKTIILDNKQVYQKLKPGHTVFLDDAFIQLEVVKKLQNEIILRVIEGGILKSNKSANFPDIELAMPAVSPKDLKGLDYLKNDPIDYVGLSFVRTAEDIRELKKILKSKKINAGIIAKIETRQAIKNIDEIIDVSDGIMVARGDLAVEFAFEKVPYIQKEIIAACRMKGKPVIVATQMLQSMIQSPRPTRAEASDVANAIYDSTDCLMLSEESAAGRFPIKAVSTMAKIADFIEEKTSPEIFQLDLQEMNEVITKSAYDISLSSFASENNVQKILVLTETGKSAHLVSRFRPKIEVIAVSPNKTTANQLQLSYGITPFYHKFGRGKVHSVRNLISFLKEKKTVKKGEKVLLIHGESWGNPGRTNTLRIQEIY